MRVRLAEESDTATLLNFPVDPAVRSVDASRLRAELAERQMRLEWSWVVEAEDSSLVGRALWWGRADSDTPLALDCLHVLDGVADRVEVAAELLRRAHAGFRAESVSALPEYNVMLLPGWREDETVVSAVAWRQEAAGAAGLTEQVERLRYGWSPADGVPAPSERLLFRSGRAEEFLELLRQVAVNTRDVTTRRALAVSDPRAQAQDDYEFYLGCPGERDWWRVATIPDGTPVGFVIPSATPYSRNVGYLGVVPPYRGRGLVDDLLAEATRVHAAEGGERITATTDVTNAPMVGAFDRAGYRVTEARLVLEAPVVASVG